jgi:putative transposase
VLVLESLKSNNLTTMQMLFTDDQITDILESHVRQGGGIHELLRMTLEAIMRGERQAFLEDWGSGNKANGFRSASAYGHGQKLEFKVPRDRLGAFRPLIMGLLRDQDEECDRLVSSLYSKGLTQSQVSDVFEQVYGKQYSTSSISRMLDGIREEVNMWMSRPLEKHYPVVFIDALYVKVRTLGSVEPEAFFVILGVTPERTREVLALGHLPTESATGWAALLDEIKSRGVESIGLLVADGIKGLDEALALRFPETPLQRCVVHLMRRITSKVKVKDREAVAQDLKEVFTTGIRDDKPKDGWNRLQSFCEKWGKRSRSIKMMVGNPWYLNYFTYLNYDCRMQSMIYTTNWIERLQRDFRRVLRMRAVMPNPESVLLLMAKTAMDKKAYTRKVPKLAFDKSLFPDGGHDHHLENQQDLF